MHFMKYHILFWCSPPGPFPNRKRFISFLLPIIIFVQCVSSPILIKGKNIYGSFLQSMHWTEKTTPFSKILLSTCKILVRVIFCKTNNHKSATHWFALPRALICYHVGQTSSYDSWLNTFTFLIYDIWQTTPLYHIYI